MHSLYFVQLKKENATTSEQARQKVQQILDDNNFSSDNQGFYGNAKADWYVIGGRWSGVLNEHIQENKDKEAEATKELNILLGTYGTKHDLQTHKINEHLLTPEQRKELEDTYTKITGLPFFRDTYKHLGYDDDAMLVTEEMAKELIEKYGEAEMAVTDDTEAIEDERELSNFTPSELVDTWLVVVDYHS